MNTKKPTLPAKGPRPVILPTLIRSRADRAANAWLEGYNPLRGLTLRRAQMIFDAARRGNDVRLQWIYENIEQSDPTLMICAERRASALVDLDWTVRPKAAGRTRGFDEALAREQTAFLEHAYGDAEENNLFPAIEHLSKAFFRGHAHIRPLWSADGLTLRGFDLLNGWNLCRDTVTDRWHWNPSASETLDFASLSPVPPGELVTLVRSRHIDYPAMAIYLRNGLGEREWGRFLERYGIPPVIITMPDTIDPSQVDAFCARAVDLNNGASGALPAGSVPQAADGDDELRVGRVVLELVAQALDVDGERVLLHVGARVVPERLAHHVARDQPARVLGKEEKQPVLERGERDLLSVQLHVCAVGVDAHSPEAQHRPLGVRAADGGVDAGHELARAEGLGNVVVRPHGEARHGVELVVGGGEEDHRHVRRRGLDGVADGKAVALREREVHEREGVARAGPAGELDGARLGGGGVHDKALVGQKLREPLHDELVVLREKYALHGTPFVPTEYRVATLRSRVTVSSRAPVPPDASGAQA